MTESGTFETQTDYLESAPSPKRARFEGQQPEIVSVSGEDGTVTITVPQTQFEIEINSQQEEEEDDGSPSREIHQIQAGDLAGPAFEVIHEAKVRKKALHGQDLHPFMRFVEWSFIGLGFGAYTFS